jgi:hypothetical protein
VNELQWNEEIVAYLMVPLGNFLRGAKKYDEIFIKIDGFWNL